MRGGAIPQNLSGFKSLNLTAAGGNTLTITLLKQSITKWEDQYSLQLPTSIASKDYRIALDDFVSAANKNSKLIPNDITAMVISLGSDNGQRKEINNSIGHVSFSKVDIAYLQSLELKDIAAYPNPNKGKFTAKFKADKIYEVTIKITEVSNGKTVFSKTINTIIGDNNIDIDISQKINGSGTYIVSIEGDTVKYKPKMLIVQ